MTKTIEEWTQEIRDYVAKVFDPWLCWENLPKGLMYLVTECSEAMEAWRDDRLYGEIIDGKYKEGVADELADIAIRLFDTAGALGINLEEEIDKKMKKNWTRAHNHGKVNV